MIKNDEIIEILESACSIYNNNRSDENIKSAVLILFAIFYLWPHGDNPPSDLKSSIYYIRELSHVERFTFFIIYLNKIDGNLIDNCDLKKLFKHPAVFYERIENVKGDAVYCEGNLLFGESPKSLIKVIFGNS